MFDLSILGVTPGFDGVSFRYPDFDRVTSQGERRPFENIDSDLFALDASMTSVVQMVRVTGNQHVHTWIGLYRPLRESRNSDRIGGYVGVGVWLIDVVCEAPSLVRLLVSVQDMIAERLIRGGVFVSGLGALTPGDFIDLTRRANDVAIGLIPLLRERPYPGTSANRCVILPDEDEATWASAIDRIQRSRLFVESARWLVGAGPRVAQSARAHGRLTVDSLARFEELDDELRRLPTVEPPPRAEIAPRGRTAETPPPRRTSTSIVPVAPPRGGVPIEPPQRAREIVDTMPESDPAILRSVTVIAYDVKTILKVTERMENDILDICREIERIKCSNNKIDLPNLYRRYAPKLLLFGAVFATVLTGGLFMMRQTEQQKPVSTQQPGGASGTGTGNPAGVGGAGTAGAHNEAPQGNDTTPPKQITAPAKEEVKDAASLLVDRRKYDDARNTCDAFFISQPTTAQQNKILTEQIARNTIAKQHNDLMSICSNLSGMKN